MPELRKDPLVGRWVIVATERARRPGNFIDPYRGTSRYTEGTFLQKSESLEEIFSMHGRVRVVKAAQPLMGNISLQNSGKGLYDVLSGYGAHEIIIETPDKTANMADLSVEQIELVIKTYVERFKALEQDAHISHVFVYKSYDGKKLANHTFSYSQILGTPVIPLNMRQQFTGAKKYYDFHERCLFMDLLKQESANKVRVVKETEHFVALTPFAARFPFEINIIPRRQNAFFHKGVVGVERDLAFMLKDILKRLKNGLDDPAYTLAINTGPFHTENEKGPKWRSLKEDYCWQIEVIPCLTHVAGFEKGTDFYICAIPPEVSAEYLREVNTSDE